MGRDTAVGTATLYGLDGRGIEFRCVRNFQHPSRQALRLTQVPAQWVQGCLETRLEAHRKCRKQGNQLRYTLACTKCLHKATAHPSLRMWLSTYTHILQSRPSTLTISKNFRLCKNEELTSCLPAICISSQGLALVATVTVHPLYAFKNRAVFESCMFSKCNTEGSVGT